MKKLTPDVSRSLARLLVLAPLVVAAASTVGLGACVSTSSSAPTPPSSEPADGADADAADELNSCTTPRKYFATLGEGESCSPVSGAGGQWLPKPLFADAPPDVATQSCVYGWSGPASTLPDGAALRAALSLRDGLTEACGGSAQPAVGVLDPIPGVDAGQSIGAAGCDVCGRARNGRIWVVLPPDRVAVRQVSIALQNGTTRAFQIAPTTARALSMKLPPPPAGTAYVDGQVTVY